MRTVMHNSLNRFIINQRSLIALFILIVVVALMNPKFISPDNLLITPVSSVSMSRASVVV